MVAQREKYSDPFKLDMAITGEHIVNDLHTKVVGVYTNSLTVEYDSSEAFRISLLPPITTAGEIEVGEVGKPIPATEVKIIDEDGNVLRKHENGELCIRSICDFEKYYKNTELTNKVQLPGKWSRSGDNNAHQ